MDTGNVRFVRRSKGKGLLEDSCKPKGRRKIIPQLMSKKSAVRLWTGFICFRTEISNSI